MSSTLILFIFIIVMIRIISLFCFNWRNKYINPVTGIWNLRKFEKEVSRQLDTTKRTSIKNNFVIGVMDFNDFKYLNKKYGKIYGDVFLRKVAIHLREKLKEDGAFIAHGEADHFYTFYKLKPGETREDFLARIEKYDEEYSLKRYFGLYVKQGFVFVNSQTNIDSVFDLIAKGSFARSSIKNDNQKSFIFFDKMMESSMFSRVTTDGSFYSALNNNEFYVVYQPQINLSTQKVVAAESLVRWRTKDSKVLNPEEFLPAFEDYGYICQLDFFVYEEVCKFIRYCLDSEIAIVPISVNMARQHLDSPNFADRFVALLKKYDIPHNYIKIEILERYCNYNNDNLKKLLARFHEENIMVAIDDFGTGESSLCMLDEYQISEIKIDKRMIQKTNLSGDIQHILRHIVMLSKDLQKKIVCEGVETGDQMSLLKKLNCDVAQGYYFSKPQSQIGFLSYMRAHS